MNRREFLAALAGIPVVVLTKPAEAGSAISVPVGSLNKWRGPEAVPLDMPPLGQNMPEPKPEWIKLADQLWTNLAKYVETDQARYNVKWDETELRHTQAICYRMCNNLMVEAEREDTYAARSLIQDCMKTFYPEVPQDILKTVKFLAVDSPIAIYEGQAAPCQARKVKLRYNPAVFEDLAAYHGIDAECELVSAWGQEVALEIALEICLAYKEGKPVKAYALYMPPFLGAKEYPYTPKDFSVDRRARMRYAKFY